MRSYLLSNTMLKYFFLGVLVFCANISFSQKPPIKFGKVTQVDLEMTHYELDSSASAVILCDYGNSYIDYRAKGWVVVHKRIARIKILSKDGYEHANQSFTLYKKYGIKESLGELKGATYNLEGGKIIKTKLTKESIFNEEVDDSHDRIKISLPAVKEGSVIEFTYTLTSPFIFNFQGWQFQYEIPVIWSEYRAKFLEYFHYNMDFQGYISASMAEDTHGQQTYTVKTETQRTGGERTNSNNKSYNASFDAKRFVLENIPAFKTESNMTTKWDYLSMISFELEETNFPSSGYKRYRGTWQSLNKELLEYETLGDKINGGLYLNEIVKSIIKEEDGESQKITKIQAYITSNISWNKKNTKYSSQSFRKTIEEKKGSSADINLLMANMLNKAGIETEAVLLSTRSNGTIKEYNATSSQFNYVICKAKFDDQFVLLDATEKWLPAGVLPERCLNNRGYNLSETNPGWVDLESKTKRMTKISGSLVLDEEGLSGTITKSYGGYNALARRKKIQYEGEENYKDNIIENSTWEIDEINIINQKDLSNNLKESYEVSIADQTDHLGDKIYINSVITKPFDSNPYKLEERMYPVSYSSLISYLYYTNIEVPEGYLIKELPQNISVALPEKAGAFVFSSSSLNNKITIMCKFTINKKTFVPEEYPYLKAFYAQAVSKINEHIIIEKSI